MVACTRRRMAFTLVEALIAVAMTLVIMLALAQGFKRMSDDISEGRARLNLSDQLRGVSELLRNDLEGLTVACDPMSKDAKNGYFLYYEGPIADHHPITAPINNLLLSGGKMEENLSASRYGDFDDILMFTAKAKGEWFKGRIPLALVNGTLGASYSPTAADWINTVVVASEYAEIAWFMMPESEPITILGNASPNPTIGYATDNANNLPIVDDETPVNPGVAVPPYAAGAFPPDVRGVGANVGNGVPDRMRLCRRVLLILPELNVPTLTPPQLYGTTTAASRLTLPAINNSARTRFALQNPYQRLDLSVSRAPSPIAANSPLRANSLEDLAHPANRFAHVMLLATSVGGAGTDRTMPILSLTAPIGLQRFAVFGNVNLALRTGADQTFPEAGFINPRFLKRAIDPATGNVLLDENGVEVLSHEEVVASNCIAFDIKGFDPIARVLHNPGEDGQPGIALRDDDGNGAVDDLSELGWSGTDDLEVVPSDPGYTESIRILTPTPTATALSRFTSRSGCFADIGWALKRWQPSDPSTRPQITVSRIPDVMRETALSGVATSSVNVSDTLFQSGRVVGFGTIPFTASVFQPCFDTFTDAFERDGFRQRTVGGGIKGVVFNSGQDWLQGNADTVNPPGVADHAANGIDDNADGFADDFSERETTPPITLVMPAIQASIRVQDVTAGVMQQIAVTHDLVTQ